MPAVVLASENTVHPHLSSVCGKHQEAVVTAALREVLPEVILLEAEEVGERAVFRLVTNSIRMRMNHTSTTALRGVPRPQAIVKEPTLRTLDVLGRAHSYPRTSLYII